jgi:hypothetical protein
LGWEGAAWEFRARLGRDLGLGRSGTPTLIEVVLRNGLLLSGIEFGG